MTNQKTVVLNTPKSIDTKYLFNLLKLKSKHKITDVNLHHINFIIHQINFFTKKYGWCDFDSKGYFQTLGCTSNIVFTILIILQEEGIIKRTRRGNNENRMVSSYVYINPFNYNNPDECNEHKYLTNYKSTPKFINVWVQNNFKIVRKPEKEKSIKPEPKAKKVKPLNKAEQVKLIIELQAEITRLQGLCSSIDTGVSEVIRAPVAALNKVVFTPVANNKFSKSKPEDVTMCEAHIDTKPEYNDEKYIINENTSVTNAGVLLDYFSTCKIDNSEYIKNFIADSSVRNYITIKDFKNNREIIGSKIRVDNQILFTINEIK